MSPKGEGAYPQFEDVAYVVYDTQSPYPDNPINVKASMQAAREAIGDRVAARLRKEGKDKYDPEGG